MKFINGQNIQARSNTLKVEDCICWNGMTLTQQDMLNRVGVIQEGHYGDIMGGRCKNLAAVKVGGRFYCATCAAEVGK